MPLLALLTHYWPMDIGFAVLPLKDTSHTQTGQGHRPIPNPPPPPPTATPKASPPPPPTLTPHIHLTGRARTCCHRRSFWQDRIRVRRASGEPGSTHAFSARAITSTRATRTTHASSSWPHDLGGAHVNFPCLLPKPSLQRGSLLFDSRCNLSGLAPHSPHPLRQPPLVPITRSRSGAQGAAMGTTKHPVVLAVMWKLLSTLNQAPPLVSSLARCPPRPPTRTHARTHERARARHAPSSTRRAPRPAQPAAPPRPASVHSSPPRPSATARSA